jgi:hypothetical protein
MRIHLSALSHVDVNAALALSQTYAEKWEWHGSRRRPHALEITLRGNSKRRPNYGTGPRTDDGYAATWDQWGVFLAKLFEVDPTITCDYYADADEFHTRTAGRFEDLSVIPPLDHDHAWKFVGVRTYACKCGATRTW